jgi:aminoglycoside phosphotransferase (APT) family kinase protein
MLIEDPLLPAAAHLTGSGAGDVLRPVIAAAGGELIGCRPSHVQYRPESDLVVRYRCQIRRGHHDTTDTVLAATTIAGPPAGTVPIEALTPDGTALSVGVWRWPFDPILTDLASIVTPDLAAQQLRGVVRGRLDLEVVAYRPTERAVVRIRDDERELYVKVVPPAATSALVARHDTLADAGLPVPRVIASGEGWLAMEALAGTTLRDRLKQGDGRLPPPRRYLELLDTLAALDLSGTAPVRSRIDDARHHAAMLATVMPDARERLDAIVDRLSTDSAALRISGTVHGDLHEAQIVVDDHAVTGLLDIDDVGPGDPLDDVATLVAHLTFRAMTSADQRIHDYAQSVRAAVGSGHDRSDVDRHVAAVLVGLATGPFRIQQPEWTSTTRQVLDLVDQHLAAADGTVPTTTPR